MFRADGQTDMTKRTVAFRNFAKAPNNAHTSMQEFTQKICLTKSEIHPAILGAPQAVKPHVDWYSLKLPDSLTQATRVVVY